MQTQIEKSLQEFQIEKMKLDMELEQMRLDHAFRLHQLDLEVLGCLPGKIVCELAYLCCASILEEHVCNHLRGIIDRGMAESSEELPRLHP